MAGSYDLYSVSQSWLTIQPVQSVNLSGMPEMASAISIVDLFEPLHEASGYKLFSSPAEMAEDGLNLLSVLNRFIASNGHYERAELSEALFLAEGLIRAGHALSKTEGGAA